MTHPFSQRKLGEILLKKQYINFDELQNSLENKEGMLGEDLKKKGLINDKQLTESLAEQFHYDFVELNDINIEPSLFEVLPANIANQYQVVPVSLDSNELKVVSYDPFDLILPDKLEKITGKNITIALGVRSEIESILKRSNSDSEVLKNISENFKPVFIKEDEDGNEREIEFSLSDEETAPVIKLVYSIISAALQKRASDIHIEVFTEGINVKYRIDGVLYPATEVLDKKFHSALITRLKVMSDLDIAEKRIPQDGRFKLRIGYKNIDFRVSLLPSIYGEDVVIRILDKSSIDSDLQNLTVASLGLSNKAQYKFRKAINEPYGMVLITGPTGSGKTTTLYAAVTELNTGFEKIITVEDPVEYQLDGIVQIQVNEKKNLTFAKGLRSILRHDPDKIMVGEIRDSETAQIAVQSALTGHLVFSTVHANNAFDVVSRFSHMGIELNNLISALNCVVAQRLVRKICPKCKVEYQPTTEQLVESGISADAENKYYKGEGCDYCGKTGYRGRSAIIELLNLTPNLRDMMAKNATYSELQSVAIDEGMETLRQSAIRMMHRSETTLEEINRVTFVD